MTPERSSSSNTVTTGGSGFGVMATVVGVERKWIDRADAIDHLSKMLDFLEKVPRFHGAWAHWMNGESATVIAFSKLDNGGDLVETSFMMAGLLTAQAYFNGSSTAEKGLRDRIQKLWEEVEWDWYVKDGQLKWHWSPTNGFEINAPIRGYHEALITYVLALASPTHPIKADVYENTWKTSSTYLNGRDYYGYKLPLGEDFGGPLFFAHYSFLGLDPRLMKDAGTNYWEQNVKHTLINRAYCIEGAPKANGYSDSIWGLTASDQSNGYAAHSPKNDNGTVTPTAALSSFPYAPFYAMNAMKGFNNKSRLTAGNYGFYDAFSPKEGWYSDQYLAIDQGPIVVMMENYRSELIWKLMMSNTDVKRGLSKGGINAPVYQTGFYLAIPEAKSNKLDLMKHVDRELYEIDFYVATADKVSIDLLDANGVVQKSLVKDKTYTAGPQRLGFDASTGNYQLKLVSGSKTETLDIRLN
jgi:hypothetical protein